MPKEASTGVLNQDVEPKMVRPQREKQGFLRNDDSSLDPPECQ